MREAGEWSVKEGFRRRMIDFDKLKNYECTGQMSLFDGMLTELCDTKPEIGRKLTFHYMGKDHECTVAAYCGADFFYVEFTGRQPSDDYPEVDDSGGWHISLRGYKKDWDFR